MAHGGKRPNAGRKTGALTVRTREVAEQAIAEGVTPLQVMLDNMRFYHEGSLKLIENLMKNGAPPIEGEEGQPQEPNADVIEALRNVLSFRKMAGEEAARAAPYVHPRIGIDAGVGSSDPEFVPLAERLAYYQRQDDLKAAGDNVVDLTKKKP